MAIYSSSRAASVDEIAAEMDRRGAAIERLEAEIERLTRALAGANSLVSDIERAVSGWRAYRDLADAVTCRLADLTRERDEARRLAALGCDANGGGPHKIMADRSYRFCAACGETVQDPRLIERLRAATTRAEAAETEAAKIRDRVTALEAGLKPFADIADAYDDGEADDFEVWLGSSLPLRIFRAARALVEGGTNG